jgi:EAL domain-containing protein (putative c-di-GMP-specific phosphodiesterase class I)
VEAWVHDPAEPYATSLAKADVRGVGYAPVHHDGVVIGVLAVGSARDDAVAQLSSQLGAIVDFADLAGAILGTRVHDRTEVGRLRAEIQAIIADHAFAPVFQPIVDISHGQTVGHEGLTRFADGVRPDLRFADAEAVGLGIELEQATLAAVVAASATLSRSRWLHLNVSPDLVLARTELQQVLRTARARIVLEVTEHAVVRDYAEFRAAIDSIGQPVRLAVDDAGAGFSSLRHILELRPAFVKLDLSIVTAIEHDPVRQALVSALVYFSGKTGSQLIAEGIETESEARVLRELGVNLGQGYLFGRPARAPGR